MFDNRPVQIKNNRLEFDKFAIYTTSKNPFTIDGYVDFRDMSRPMANLNMLAQNYTLLDAKRTRESLVYGKVFADFRATVKGPLDGLNMRGNVSLLGNHRCFVCLDRFTIDSTGPFGKFGNIYFI